MVEYDGVMVEKLASFNNIMNHCFCIFIYCLVTHKRTSLYQILQYQELMTLKTIISIYDLP